MVRILFTLIISITTSNCICGQGLKPGVNVDGYIETFFSYDFSEPTDHQRPDFIYSYNRHNEVNINLAFLKASFNDTNSRANLAFMTGTYSNANMVNEPGILKNILEASIGFKILKNKQLWVDIGVLPSHIGFESAVGRDCWNLTRSIAADNSPYFESGVALTYTSFNQKWLARFLVLNGWQRISRPPDNQTPAFGHQITYQPNARIKLNSSSFFGNDYPKNFRKLRYFHNLYSQMQIQKKLYLIAGIDIGAEQTAEFNDKYNLWYSPVLIFKYIPFQKWAVSLRGEYYSDQYQVIIKTNTLNGFQTTGISTNIDWEITDRILWRLEARGLYSKDEIFLGKNTRINGAISTSISMMLNTLK